MNLGDILMFSFTSWTFLVLLIGLLKQNLNFLEREIDEKVARLIIKTEI